MGSWDKLAVLCYITFIVKLYDFDRNEFFKDGFDSKFIASVQNGLNRDKLAVTLTCLDGKPYSSFNYGCVQHEVHHYFENSMSPNSFIPERDYAESAKYANHSDPMVREISLMYYMSFKGEREAHANGLYGQLMKARNRKRESFERAYYESPEHKILETLGKLLNRFETDDFTYFGQIFLEAYVFTQTDDHNLNQFLRHLTSIYRDYSSRLIRAYSLAYENAHINEQFLFR